MEGATPYPGLTNPEVIDYVREGKILPRPQGEKYPIEIYDIMKKCWNLNPQERPTFDDLVKYFEELERPYTTEKVNDNSSDIKSVVTNQAEYTNMPVRNSDDHFYGNKTE